MFCFWFYRERETYSLVHLTFHVKKNWKESETYVYHENLCEST